ncbi:MAG: rRNA maturation RNase YbeY [Sandaracinaceae bacterium]|nr:rRNA maturation RNase YbeY [Sandaracinaceae bacterium]
MLEALGLPRAELSILLCDDATIHELNRSYRRKDRPTDVLAFAMHEGEGGALHPDLLGDVVISIDTARRQAAEARRPVAAEVTFLLAHGLLHLLGLDHRTRAEERRMSARTDVLVAAARPRRR